MSTSTIKRDGQAQLRVAVIGGSLIIVQAVEGATHLRMRGGNTWQDRLRDTLCTMLVPDLSKILLSPSASNLVYADLATCDHRVPNGARYRAEALGKVKLAAKQVVAGYR